jgi:hypothetical protein
VNDFVITHFVGIDVQVSRGCACAILQADGSTTGTTWADEGKDLLKEVTSLIEGDGATLGSSVVAIDCPRQARTSLREHYWDGKKARWTGRSQSDKGHGRHCEVVIRAHKLAMDTSRDQRSAMDDAWLRTLLAVRRGAARA